MVELGSNTLTLTDASGTFSGVISDPAGGGLVIAAGTEILTGDNTYTGGTTIDALASLQLGNGGASGSLTSDVDDEGTFTFDRSDTYTFANAITGAGVVVQAGSGTTVLTGTNDYTGGTNINGGTLSVAGQSNLGTGAIAMADGTTLAITATGSFTNAVTLTGDPTFNVASGTTTTWSGLISGAGDLVATGGGTLALTNTSNAYTLGTIVEGGSTLLLDADHEIGAATGGLTLGDASTTGTLKLGASFNLAGARAFSLGVGGGTIDTGIYNTTVSQVISGLGGLTKLGTGTLTLANTNTYSGGTTISAGTLQLGNGTGPRARSPATFWIMQHSPSIIPAASPMRASSQAAATSRRSRAPRC